jgi:hypothetical protein
MPTTKYTSISSSRFSNTRTLLLRLKPRAYKPFADRGCLSLESHNPTKTVPVSGEPTAFKTSIRLWSTIPATAMALTIH